jgi:hypothetical protein
MNPAREAHPFTSSPTQRADIVLRRQVRRTTAIDVAVTFPLRLGAPVSAAAETPGGAATLYENVKWHEYGEAASRANIDFVPFVFDTFGAIGSSAWPLLRSIFRCAAQRRGISRVVATQSGLLDLNVHLMRGVAHILLMNAQ